MGLWDFAAACYARPGVAEVCLLAQDRCNADVNLLLAAAWLAGRNTCWTPDDVVALTALCADWRSYCVLPLRAVRRYLKQQSSAEELYVGVKKMELQAEKLQLELLEAALADCAHAPAAGTDPLSHNLNVYFEVSTAPRRIDDELLARVAAAMRPPEEHRP